MNNKKHFQLLAVFFFAGIQCFSQNKVERLDTVTLREAHKGTNTIDLRLLESFGKAQENTENFFLEARQHFTENSTANFTDKEIVAAAKKQNMILMGGPMLGKLTSTSVELWIRPVCTSKLKIKISTPGGKKEKTITVTPLSAGQAQRVALNRLSPNTPYNYAVYANKNNVAKGSFTTAPESNTEGMFRITFGSCFHKIGLHNPNLINEIIKRQPKAMMLLGDIAVDDREDHINMHRSDYLLRDMSPAWQKLAANVPLYTSWDDHDYLNNDLSGIPDRFSTDDLKALRAVWEQNWNNPKNNKPGIYFNTRIGPVEIIMLDTRSCRTVSQRHEYGSYLGDEQLKWLKMTLKNSDAPFKIISSGTMWSDYITNGKDSWGTWDTTAREEIFNFIETENIDGVLLISGDRHGARGFTIPRHSGYRFYEFEAGSLGGVPGPPAYAKDKTNQLFGYLGIDIIAFGEFSFYTSGDHPKLIFRLINQFGKVLEEHEILYKELMP